MSSRYVRDTIANMERKYRLNRIHNLTPEEEKSKQEALLSITEEHRHPAIKKEIRKSREVFLLIEQLCKIAAAVAAHFGGRTIDMDPSKIHLLPSSEDLPDIPEKEKYAGVYSMFEGRIYVVYDPHEDSSYLFSRTVAHELMHAHSWNTSTFLTRNGITDANTRTGLRFSSSPDEKTYFNYLNEAITEELSVLVVGKSHETLSPSAQVFKEKLIQITSGDKEGEAIALYEALCRDFPLEAQAFEEEFIKSSIPYMDSRLAFKILLSLLEKRDIPHEEASALFFKAYFSGNIGALTRMFDGVFGKGMFRALGEASNISEDEFLSFVKKLEKK